jgi:hypothetical protein
VILTTVWWWQKIRVRLAVSKQRSYRFHMQSFNLKKLNEIDGKEQHQVDISNRYAAFENFDTEVDTISASETIRENTKISAKES